MTTKIELAGKNVKLTSRIDENVLQAAQWVIAGTKRTGPQFWTEAARRQIAWEEEDMSRPWVDPVTEVSRANLKPGEPYPDPPGRRIRLKPGRPPETF